VREGGKQNTRGKEGSSSYLTTVCVVQVASLGAERRAGCAARSREMAALGAKAMRMQVECPICNTKLVFEVLPQYAGRTVRVTCTNYETPIDASTDMPASSAHQMQHFEQETRLQLANGLASRMHGQAPQNSGPGVEINKLIQQNPNMQQHNVQQQIQQQQHQLQKTSQQQKQDNGAGKNSTETLQYEVQCPHPEVCIRTIFKMILILRLTFLSSMLNQSHNNPTIFTAFTTLYYLVLADLFSPLVFFSLLSTMCSARKKS